MSTPQIEPAAEFQKLPLEMVIGTPLVAVAKAQAIAAQTTLDFVRGLCDPPVAAAGGAAGAPQTLTPRAIQLSMERKDPANPNAPATSAVIKAPLLAIVPIPHLLIDSVTINFKYEIAQTFRDTSQTSGSADVTAGTGAALSPFVSATFHGNVTHSSSSESNTNRGGTLEIMVRASQSPIPVGLDRLITMLSQAIEPK
jgi:hypothetical protein